MLSSKAGATHGSDTSELNKLGKNDSLNGLISKWIVYLISDLVNGSISEWIVYLISDVVN
jgi:hypothetical protein